MLEIKHKGIVAYSLIVALSTAIGGCQVSFENNGDLLAAAAEHDASETQTLPLPSYRPTYTIDNDLVVNNMLDGLVQANLPATIDALASFHTRHACTESGRGASEYVAQLWGQYAALRPDVSVELVEHDPTETDECELQQPSVIAEIPGTEEPDIIVIIGAHIDSINHGNKDTDPNEDTGTEVDTDTEYARAPGADDNASGVAVISEVLRMAMATDFRPKRTVRFVAYAGEELGQVGSRAIAGSQLLKSYNQIEDVAGVLNLDMTNYHEQGKVDFSIWEGATDTDQNQFLVALIDNYLDATWAFLYCPIVCGGSDHIPWDTAGFPVSFPTEAPKGSLNPMVHTEDDTLANSDSTGAKAFKFAELTTAYLGELAKGDVTDSPTPGPLLIPQGQEENLSAAPEKRLLRRRPVTIDVHQLTAADNAVGRTLQFNLFDDKNFEGTVQRTVIRSHTSFTLWGTLLNGAGGYFILTTENGHLVADIHPSHENLFQIVFKGDELYDVREVNFGPFEVTATPQNVELPDNEKAVLDYLAISTPAARRSVGGFEAIELLVRKNVDYTNIALENSRIYVKINLVATLESPHYESHALTAVEYNNYATYSREVTSDPEFCSILPDYFCITYLEDWRDALGADLVSVITGFGLPFSTIPIIANLDPEVPLQAIDGINFVSTPFIEIDSYVLPHELGHNFGCGHTALEDAEVDPAKSNPNAHAYAVPEGQPNRFTTLTSFGDDDVPRVALYSNPDTDVQFENQPVGTTEANCAATANIMAPTIAQYRQSDYCDQVGPFTTEIDCNHNGIIDLCGALDGREVDVNRNGIPDNCTNLEPDLDTDSQLDSIQMGHNDPALDCNQNFVLDSYEILHNLTLDTDSDQVLDDCQKTILFVFGGAWGPYMGTKATPYTTLQEALSHAARDASVTEIRLSEGVYYPSDGGTDNRQRFTLRDNLKISGGWDNLFTEAKPHETTTILEGNNFQRPNDGPGGSTFDNASTVVEAIGLDESAVLEGVTVQGAVSDDGAGAINILGGNPTFTNVTIKNNLGRAVYIQDAYPTFTSCRFEENSAPDGAGALLINSSAYFESSLFANNIATDNGGAIYLSSSSPATEITLQNCTIADNNAAGTGGVFADDQGHIELNSSILWNNGGSALQDQISAASFSASFSLISELDTSFGLNNLNTDPLLNPLNGYAPFAASPCVDAGDPGAQLAPKDVQNYTRITGCNGDLLDMGASELNLETDVDEDGNPDVCEFQSAPWSVPAGTCPFDWDGDGTVNQDDYFTSDLGGFYSCWYVYSYYPQYYLTICPTIDINRLDWDRDFEITISDNYTSTAFTGFRDGWYISTQYPEYFEILFPDLVSVCPVTL